MPIIISSIDENVKNMSKEANELCDRDYDLFFYNGKHCRNFFEEREGYSKQQAKDICQFIFTHKFQKSNP
jgi:hypothetical protein